MSNLTYVIQATLSSDVAAYHPIIVAAIENGGVFEDDFADIFALTNLGPINADGSDRWSLDFAEDDAVMHTAEREAEQHAERALGY